jgi:hypothetical protein
MNNIGTSTQFQVLAQFLDTVQSLRHVCVQQDSRYPFQRMLNLLVFANYRPMPSTFFQSCYTNGGMCKRQRNCTAKAKLSICLVN